MMYERYVSTPFAARVIFELVDPLQLAGVYLRLGELYEQQGSAATAVATTRRSSTCGRTPTANCSRAWPRRVDACSDCVREAAGVMGPAALCRSGAGPGVAAALLITSGPVRRHAL